MIGSRLRWNWTQPVQQLETPPDEDYKPITRVPLGDGTCMNLVAGFSLRKLQMWFQVKLQLKYSN